MIGHMKEEEYKLEDEDITPYKIELLFSCKNLQPKEYLYSHEFFLVANSKDNYFESEKTMDTSPSFLKTMKVEYYPTTSQLFTFSVYQMNPFVTKKTYVDFIDDKPRFFLIGSFTCELDEIIDSKECHLEVDLENMESPTFNAGELHISAEIMQDPEFFNTGKNVSMNYKIHDKFQRMHDYIVRLPNEVQNYVKFQCKAVKVSKKDFFGNIATYFVISKELKKDYFHPVYISETVRTVDPKWDSFEIDLENLCSNDFKKNLKFEIFSVSSLGISSIIGSSLLTLKEIPETRCMEMYNATLKKRTDIDFVFLNVFQNSRTTKIISKEFRKAFNEMVSITRGLKYSDVHFVHLFVECKYPEISDTSVMVYFDGEEFETELIEESKNPKFKNVFEFPFLFEKHQHLTFSVLNKNKSLVGTFRCKLANIIGSHDHFVIGSILDSEKKITGEITIFIDPEYEQKVFPELVNSKAKMDFEIVMKTKRLKDYIDKFPIIEEEEAVFQCEFKNTKNYFTNLLTSYPSFKISKKYGSILFPFYESKKMTNEKIHLNLRYLCNGDFNFPIHFEVFESQKVGEFTTTINNIMMGKFKYELLHRDLHYGNFIFKSFSLEGSSVPFPLSEFNDAMYELKETENLLSGDLAYINRYPIVKPPENFHDYVFSNLEFSLYYAIDFTKSNGKDINAQECLHNLEKQNGNVYQQMITSIGSIFEEYNPSTKYFAFGCGGNVTEANFKAFPLFGTPKGSCKNVNDVLRAYEETAVKVSISSDKPNISYILREMIEKSYKEIKKNQNSYNVLVLITSSDFLARDNGSLLSDYLVINAARCGISIVVVGVGEAGFAENSVMSKAAVIHDGNMFQNVGFENKSVRDMFQFVRYNDYMDAEECAQEALKDIPFQVVEHFALNQN
jgi:hypothetical protein